MIATREPTRSLAQKLRTGGPGATEGSFTESRHGSPELDERDVEMTAGELMRSGFEIAHPETRLELATRVVSAESGPLLVCEHGRLIGALDHRELTATMARRDAGARRLRLRDIVPRDILYCFEATDVAEAVALMREHHVEWIPVLAADRRPVGLLALADIPGGALGSSGSPGREAAHAERGTERV